MKRHYFTVAVVCASLFLACPIPAAEVIELKLAHFIPTTHIQHQETYLPFARNVEKLSSGKVKIKIYPEALWGGLCNFRTPSKRHHGYCLYLSVHDHRPLPQIFRI